MEDWERGDAGGDRPWVGSAAAKDKRQLPPTSKQTFRLDAQTVYYTSPVAVMQVFQAAAAHVELALSAVVIAYCVALFAYLRGVSAAFRGKSCVFKSPSKAHKK